MTTCQGFDASLDASGTPVGYRIMQIGEIIGPDDLVRTEVARKDVYRASHCQGLPIEEEDVGNYFRRIEPVAESPQPASTETPADREIARLKRALAYLANKDHYDLYDVGYDLIRPGGARQVGIFMISRHLAAWTFAQEVLGEKV